MRRSTRLLTSAQKTTTPHNPPSSSVDAFTWRSSETRPKSTGKLTDRRLAIKDNFMLLGTPTTCSSQMLQDFSSPYSATSVSHLLQAGAQIIGKTSMDEFGMGSNTTNLPDGVAKVYNPWTPKADDVGCKRDVSMDGAVASSSRSGEERSEHRSAGGSSGGSAVAVATGEAWAALGTDTGGSVRLPASYCGTVGFKPSYGMISRHGVVAYADSLDCVGILTGNVASARTVFEVIAQPDRKDSTCVSASVRSKTSEASEEVMRNWQGLKDGRLDGVRIGLPIETALPPHLTPFDITPLLIHLRDNLGATLVPISIPSITLSLPAYYVLACAEASSNLARYGGGWYGGSHDNGILQREDVRRWGFGEEVRKRILAGTHALTAGAFNNSYLKALHLRHQLRQDFDRIFRLAHPLRQLEPNLIDRIEAPSKGVDVLLHLTAVQTAPKLPLEAQVHSAESIPEYAQDVLTVPASLGGLPALSLPIGTGADGWPVGLSLVGQWGADQGVLAVATAGIEAFGRRQRDLP